MYQALCLVLSLYIISFNFHSEHLGQVPLSPPSTDKETEAQRWEGYKLSNIQLLVFPQKFSTCVFPPSQLLGAPAFSCSA